MDPQTMPAATALGPAGEHCAQCATPLGADQRYCLNCGHRRAPMRLAFLDVVGAPGADGIRPAPAAAHADRSPLVALGSLIALLLALGIGVLIGRGTDGDPLPVARAPVITVSAPAPAAAGAVAAAVVSDWPAGTKGYTVALQTLPATTPAADAAQAKQAAVAKGAPDVGVLKSDEYPSLEPGQILVYSGTYPARPAAVKAVRGLKADFPDAAVVRVSSAAAAAEEPAATTTPPAASSGPRSTPGYGKSTNKVPEKVVTPGAAPPVDEKAPGGGSGEATEIG